MIENKTVTVFDFDGVVCDSTDECMVTSWNAWEEWEARDNFRNDLSKFTANNKLNFRKVRPRVRGAGEYYILRRAFSENINIENQASYDELEKQWQEYIAPFKAVFFEARERLRHENLDDCIDLHPVYDEVIAVMKALNEQGRLYMATLKDAESVRLILGKQGLVIPTEKLIDQSQIKSKLQALDQFNEHIGCSKKDMIFIDDNVTHLVAPKQEGYPVLMSTWGGVLPEYISMANHHNIKMLAITEIKKLMPN